MTDLQYLQRRNDGPDVSHWQADKGPYDLTKTVAIPTFYFACKATQSVNYKDPSLDGFRKMAAAAGFTYRFLYHWLSSTTDPLAQAAWYLKTVGKLAIGEGAMLDAEEKGITVDKCLLWLEHVEEVIQRPCEVYTGIYVAGGTIWSDPRIRMSKFGPRTMHVAAYVSAQNLFDRLKALNLLDKALHAWQWSSTQEIPGITGRVDVNAVFDRHAYNRCCGILDTIPTVPNHPPLTPTPLPAQEEIMSNALFIAPRIEGQEPAFNAQFWGVCNAAGAALEVWWTGAGSEALDEMIDAHRQAGLLILPVDITGFKHTYLRGPLPTGDNAHAWTGEEFFGHNE